MRGKAECERVITTESGQIFRYEDVVTISFYATYSKDMTGRIVFIDTLEFSLDMSERYKSHIEKVRFDDVMSIKKADETEAVDDGDA